MARKLTWMMALVLALCGAALIASGEDSREAQGVDRSTLSPEQKQAMRLEADRNRPRFENVRYVTSTPVDRGDITDAPPSTTVIEYDNSVPATRWGNTGGVVVGNQFNVGGGGGPVTGPWTITGYVLQNAGTAFPAGTPAVTVVFLGGPGTGTTAPVLVAAAPSPVTGGLQTFALATPLTGTGSFLAGVVNSTWSGCTATSVPPGTTCDGVALDPTPNSTNPLGFHAMSIAAASPTAGGFATIPGLNAILKVTGSALPVELTSFSVDSE